MFVHTDTIIKQIVAEYLMNSILVAKIETVSRCVFWQSYKTFYSIQIQLCYVFRALSSLARNCNLQVVFTHASHVCSQHSIHS